jgi:hypothetical protein
MTKITLRNRFESNLHPTKTHHSVSLLSLVFQTTLARHNYFSPVLQSFGSINAKQFLEEIQCTFPHLAIFKSLFLQASELNPRTILEPALFVEVVLVRHWRLDSVIAKVLPNLLISREPHHQIEIQTGLGASGQRYAVYGVSSRMLAEPSPSPLELSLRIVQGVDTTET